MDLNEAFSKGIKNSVTFKIADEVKQSLPKPQVLWGFVGYTTYNGVHLKKSKLKRSNIR